MAWMFAGRRNGIQRARIRISGRPALISQANEMPIDISEFEQKVILRRVRMDDFDSLVAMQNKCFPGMTPWTREQLASQLRIFPDGQLCIEIDGRLAASSSSLIVDFNQYSDWHDWQSVADDGFIRNHKATGDTLYGIEIMVDPDFRGLKLSRRLYDARKALCRDRNLARIIIAGRLPGYGRYADSMTVREYAEAVVNRRLFDPVLSVQVSNGFVLKGLIPNYLPADSDSRGWAAFLEWVNLDYVRGARGGHRTVDSVRLSVVQYQMRTISCFEDFAKQCEYFVDVAGGYRCDFILFPAMLTNQLLCLTDRKSPGMAARQLSEYTERYLALFHELAVRYNVNVIGGTHFVVEEEHLRNVACLFRRDGTIARQYKLRITPGERRRWGVEQGSRLEVPETDCGRVAICVGNDIECPELARIAANRGADLIFVPFSTETREAWLRLRICAQARCVEYHQFVAIAGCVGHQPGVENAELHYAQSAIFTPIDFSFSRDGVAAECTTSTETILVHDVDLELLRRRRAGRTTRLPEWCPELDAEETERPVPDNATPVAGGRNAEFNDEAG